MDIQLDQTNSAMPKNQQHQTILTNEHQLQKIKVPWYFFGNTQTGRKILDIFEGVFYSIFITIITLISLFSDDIRIIYFSVKEDSYFSIVTCVCMFFFTLQMVVLSVLKQNYFLKFYFWIDLISTASMILDIDWFSNSLSNKGGIQAAASFAKIARASRASKIGANATKLFKFFKRLRFQKLYKTAQKKLANQGRKNDKKDEISLNRISRPSKFSTRNFQNRSSNRKWSKLNELSALKIAGPKYQVSLMNFQNQQRGSKTIIPQDAKNIDAIIQSDKSIQKGNAKHRNTENIRDLTAFKNQFKDFYQSGNSKQSKSSEQISAESSGMIQIPEQTQVALEVKSEVQKNIIGMIILIILTIPLFNASTWFDGNLTSYQKGIIQLEDILQISPSSFDQQNQYFISIMENLPSKLLYYSIVVNATCCTFPDNFTSFKVLYEVGSLSDYRAQDLSIYTTDSGSIVIYEASQTATFASQLNIGRTIIVVIVIIFGTLTFLRDVQIIVLEPLQNMFDTVRKIAASPLNAIKEIEAKKMALQEFEEPSSPQQKTEPNVLENLIVKIGGLLAVGFGEAGTQIISRVIDNPNFVNVIIPGQKVMGIYGFCDIRNFTDATEILQAEVMVFVNQIAGICHKIVNAHAGSPNKNIGDAFLLVWKFLEDDLKIPQKKNQKILELADTKRVKQLADLSVLSFVRMIAEINKSHALLKYKNNKALQKRIKNYEGVKMGFGLHVGWSIQGPIGSEYKVDASYLSPSVNMASRLEAATKEYGVPMLITGEIYELMTENKKYLRHIDRVLFDGYETPTNLYTVDLHIGSLLAQTNIEQVQITQQQKKINKIKQNIKRNKLLEQIQTKYVTKQLWNEKDIKIMRKKYNSLFYQEWDKGFNAYLQGEWNEALVIFNKIQLMAPNQKDGPSQTLIKIIQNNNRIAPPNWKGYREVQF